MTTIDATAARALSTSAATARDRKALDDAYSQIERDAKNGFRTTLLTFDPFRVNMGNVQNPAVTPFLAELNSAGFILTSETDSTGNKFLRVTW